MVKKEGKEINNKLALRLRYLREANNLDRNEMAEKMNLTYSCILQYEMGIREPRLDTLVEIAEIFKVSLDFLIGKEKNGNMQNILDIFSSENASFEEKEEVYLDISHIYFNMRTKQKMVV